MYLRITVTGAQPTDKNHILLNCTIEKSDDAVIWTALEGAPSSIALPLSSVGDALKSSTDDAEKRAALNELFRTTTRALPALIGAVAIEAIEDLIPGGWPVVVNL